MTDIPVSGGSTKVHVDVHQKPRLALDQGGARDEVAAHESEDIAGGGPESLRDHLRAARSDDPNWAESKLAKGYDAAEEAENADEQARWDAFADPERQMT